MVANGYLDPAVQKTFLPTIPGVIEHQCKLAAIISVARQSKRSLVVARLDIENPYGSVRHSLIQFALHCYHVPPDFSNLLQSWYTDVAATISTAEWESPVISLKTCVLEGDPLSVVIFLTVMATLSDMLDTRKDLGVAIPHSYSSTFSMEMIPASLLTLQQPASTFWT